MFIGVSAYAGVQNYDCGDGIWVQVEYYGEAGNKEADRITLSGTTFDGVYTAMGDGILFQQKDGGLLNPGALYSVEGAGTVKVFGSPGLTLECTGEQ
jgi:hypothetical protein